MPSLTGHRGIVTAHVSHGHAERSGTRSAGGVPSTGHHPGRLAGRFLGVNTQHHPVWTRLLAGFGKSTSGCVRSGRLCPHPRRGSAPRAPWGWTGLNGLHCLHPDRTCRWSGPECQRPIRPSDPTRKDSSSPGSPHPSERLSRCVLTSRPRLSRGRGRSWVSVGLETGSGWRCVGTVLLVSLCGWEASSGPFAPGATSRPCH